MLQISIYVLRLLRQIPLNYQCPPSAPGKSARHKAQHAVDMAVFAAGES
jgi:hypothetical protein